MEIIWGRFVEKTGGQKSRATVPLNLTTGAEVVQYMYLCKQVATQLQKWGVGWERGGRQIGKKTGLCMFCTDGNEPSACFSHEPIRKQLERCKCKIKQSLQFMLAIKVLSNLARPVLLGDLEKKGKCHLSRILLKKTGCGENLNVNQSRGMETYAETQTFATSNMNYYNTRF